MAGFFSNNRFGLEKKFITSEEFLDRCVGTRLLAIGANCFGQLGNSSGACLTSLNTVSNCLDWAQVCAGFAANIATKTDGTLWTWGFNSTGALGNNSVVNHSSPVQTVAGGTNWARVSAGDFFVGAIKCDGTLWTWGQGSYGVLGDGYVYSPGVSPNRSSPIQTAAGGTDWKDIEIKSRSVAAIKTDGKIWSWGLGEASSPSINFPGCDSAWKTIAPSGYHTLGVKSDFTLWAWGNNCYGQIGNNSTSTSLVSITQVGTSSDIRWRHVSSYLYQSAGIKQDGTLWSWGKNEYGGLGTGDTANRSSPVQTTSGGTAWRQVDVSSSRMSAVDTRDYVFNWGSTINGNTPQNYGTRAKRISIGSEHGMFLRFVGDEI